MKFCVVVPWHNQDQVNQFVGDWGGGAFRDWLIFQEDKNKEGCAKTKNKGIEKAIERGAEVIMVLDDDCLPVTPTNRELDLTRWAEAHLKALEPQPVELYEAITDPPSRGTPYFNRTVTLPVAASMGFWTGIPDLDAVSSLRNEWRLVGNELKQPMTFKRKAMFGRFFPLSGMNCAFRAEFWPYFKFEEGVGRMDDIFMGYRLQAEAYKRGYCINLNGPLIRHSRQSNVWANLRTEAEWMERNETEWQKYV